jgi:hypothetical protein
VWIGKDESAVPACNNLASHITISVISRAVGRDIGPYSRILGRLEANGEIEAVAGGVQWKLERFAVVTGDSIG